MQHQISIDVQEKRRRNKANMAKSNLNEEVVIIFMSCLWKGQNYAVELRNKAYPDIGIQ